MATISITIPDALVPRVRAALRGIWNSKMYPDYLGGYQTNPIADKTDIQAFQWIVAEYIRQEVVKWETSEAQKASIEEVQALKTQVATDVSGIG